MTSLYRKITVALSLVTLFLGSFTTVSAYEFYSYPTYPSYSAYDGYGGYYQDQTAYVRYLQEVIMQMLADRGVSTAYPVQSSVSGYSYGAGPYTFRSVDPSAYSYSPTYSIDEEPYVRTYGVRDVEDESAELRGEVDMNDFSNGFVFIAWGEDEDSVEGIEDEDEYDDIDEDGEDLQVYVADTDLDTNDDFAITIVDLDDDTDHYVVACVEYEDEDDDIIIECTDVEEFTTDED